MIITTKPWQIGVDVGGTFTDFFACNRESGVVRFHKRNSTPENPARAIAAGLTELCEKFAINPGSIERLSHGTTVATNALIQRRGARVAMVTTLGFRDLIEIARQTRPHMYSLQIDRPPPLVPREMRFEIPERVDATGTAVRALDTTALDQVIDRISASDAEACAVCFLFSFLQPAHELAVRDAIAARLPDLKVCASAEVQPEFREVERFSTAVLNAYLQPVMHAYLESLSADLNTLIPQAVVGVYQSSGGLMSLQRAKQFPVRTALSGPAAGVFGAIYTARSAQRPNVLTFDMGGTSTDVAIIRNYGAQLCFERDVAGFPVRLPMMDVHTVGAGGGSIAWFDADGLLKVGPTSAGALPGPACYGRGGRSLTVTDANLILGRLSCAGLVGGSMPLELEAARAAAGPVASRLGMSERETALGVVGIATANMVRAIRAVSVERGHDPRDYTLMPFGGAGPLHASEVARALGMREIVVPPVPGILCAQGLLVSDQKEEFVRTLRVRADALETATLAAAMADLGEKAHRWFDSEPGQSARRTLTFCFDMRYVGQNFELSVPVATADAGTRSVPPPIQELLDRFVTEHRKMYGFDNGDDPVEIINVRLTATVSAEEFPPPRHWYAGSAAAGPIGSREVCFARDSAVETPVYRREDLECGYTITGPAIIEQLDSTLVLFPGDHLVVDSAANIIIEIRS